MYVTIFYYHCPQTISLTKNTVPIVNLYVAKKNTFFHISKEIFRNFLYSCKIYAIFYQFRAIFKYFSLHIYKKRPLHCRGRYISDKNQLETNTERNVEC